ncbi:MAG: phage/plasmid primase, P4 family [Firmicutes bacterium]|nr:phage/plasmid primase, P4 family [Bacillota bacterium]
MIRDTFYKGYSPTKNKKCQIKFKDIPSSELYSLEDVQSLPEYAGILAADSILIDTDDMEQSKMLLDIVDAENIRCKVLQSRSGMHFLFKNSKVEKCYTNTRLACGLVADIKSGFKNCYEVLKIEGKERTVLYDIFEDEEYQELPKWLFPVKSGTEFLDMNAGDGRNQALFNYILTLQSNDFSVEEARETIEIINKYVLKDPLPDDELAVVLRDDSFKKPIFFKGNNFLHNLFGNYLISQHRIKKIEGKLHIYKDGVYIYDTGLIEKKMLKDIPTLTDAKRKEVLKYITVMCEDAEMATPNLIAFRNGIYNVHTGELKPFSPDVVITNRIPWDYNPNAYSELADKTLDKIACNDEQVRTILEECIGSCFYRSNTLGGGKAFILTGEGSNGKSTFISMMHRVLGTENISAMDLKNLGDRFAKASLFKKLANIGDDISDEFIPDPSLFKKIVSGDRIQAEFKGQDAFEFNPYVKLIFSANNIPRIKDKTGAVLRRLLIVPFNAKFADTDSDYDPEITYKLREQEVMEYLINLGLEALKRVLENKKFSSAVKVQKEIEEYKEFNNPVIGFFKEQEEDYLYRATTKEIHLAYSDYCKQNGYLSESSNQFGRTVKSMFGVESIPRTINKKSVRMYVKITDN